VIRNSNPDFRINADPDVRRICSKMLWMHYLVGVSYFAKYGTSRSLIMRNANKCPKIRNGEENEQELSYRKQIARELRTQYVEGIYRPKEILCSPHITVAVLSGLDI